MLLYTEAQLDEACLHDCDIRNNLGQKNFTRKRYEKLFVFYMDRILAGEQEINLKINIPRYMLESIDEEIGLELEQELH